MKSKPDKPNVPSLEAVRKYLSGEKVDAETATFGRKVEELYARYASKHKGPKLRNLILQALGTGASREQVLKKAVQAGYLKGFADNIICEALGEQKENPMEVVSLLAFAESMYGPQAGRHLQEAYLYLLWEACEAAKHWWTKKGKTTCSPSGTKPSGPGPQ